MYIVLKPFFWNRTYKCGQTLSLEIFDNEVITDYLILNEYIIDFTSENIVIDYILPTSENTFDVMEWFINR